MHYEITYAYQDTEMKENSVAYVWLYDELPTKRAATAIAPAAVETLNVDVKRKIEAEIVVQTRVVEKTITLSCWIPSRLIV